MVRKISVTMLSSYLYCARKLFLEKVLGLFEPEKIALVKGTIRHETYDEVNQIDELIVTSIKKGDAYERIFGRYMRAYSSLLMQSIKKNKYRLKTVKLNLAGAYHEIWPFFKRESEIRALNIFKFIEQKNVYGTELWDSLTPKIESEYKIFSEELQLSGIIDQIAKYKKGDVPIELKTGRMPKEGIWPGHRIQAAAYAMMLEEKSRNPVKEAIVHYLDTDTKRQITINPFLKEEVKTLKKKVVEMLEDNNVPERVKNENKCAKCGLKEKCFDDKLINELIEAKNKV